MSSSPRYPRAFWVLFAGRLLNAIGTSLIFPFLTVYLHVSLHVSLPLVGAVLLAQGAAQVLAVAVGGVLADSWGRVRTMTTSLVLGAAATLGLALAHAGWLIVLLVVARGAVMPLLEPATSALVADIVPQEQLYAAYSTQRVASNAGIIVGPMIGALIAGRSFAPLFWLSGGIAICFTVFVLLALREPPREHGSPARISLAPLRDRGMLWGVGLFTLVSLVYSQLYWVVPGYLTIYLHLPPNRFGFLAAENALLVVLLQLPVTRLSRGWTPETQLGVGTLLYAAGFLLMAPIRTFAPYFLPVGVMTLGELLIYPSITAFAARRAGQRDRGKYLALVSVANRSGSAVGPLVGGGLLTALGPVGLFVGIAILGSVTAFGYFRLGRTGPRTHGVT